MSLIGELARLAILAQQGGGGAAPPAGPAGANPGDGGILSIILGPAGFVVVMVTLFWFMIIRPQQQREADHDKMVDDLKVYDKVITIGGILATITDIRKGDDVVTLRIDEKTGAEISILKSAISRRDNEEDKEREKEAEKSNA